MKAVMISIQSKWVEKIANRKKTIEVRKKAPKQVPFKAYIYCTKDKPYLYRVDDDNNFELTNTLRPEVDVYVKDYNEQNGKVIGEFICDKLIKTCGWRLRGDTQQCAKRTTDEKAFPKLACLTIDEIVKYAGSENREVCGLHISDLKIYDKPKELSEFYKCGAKSFEELSDTEDLCSYCSRTSFCEGRWCDEAYQNYLDVDFALTHAPQSWQYVEELEE